jgi:transcriptional regulator with PAS, ATPase and Fis domain
MPAVTAKTDPRGQSVREAVRRENDFLGRSGSFLSVVSVIERVAPRQCSVVLVGETGTGKEIVARRIHLGGDRADKPFVAVDCASLAGQLLESQLFGHVKGAFTGAVSDTVGFFRAADSGTIFLDEIEELGLDLQAKLLRVLQESRVTPVGSTRSVPVDVRVIAATPKSLRKLVRDGRFRADLFFRLNVVTLVIPPLRDRKEDIILLAEHFLKKQAELYGEPPRRLNGEAKDLLLGYHWPGNVRQLANMMERAYVMSDREVIGPSALPPEILAAGILPEPEQEFPSFDRFTEKLVMRALQATGGRRKAAARLLRIDYGRLKRMLKRSASSAT